MLSSQKDHTDLVKYHITRDRAILVFASQSDWRERCSGRRDGLWGSMADKMDPALAGVRTPEQMLGIVDSTYAVLQTNTELHTEVMRGS